jgi:hypothetical protein
VKAIVLHHAGSGEAAMALQNRIQQAGVEAAGFEVSDDWRNKRDGNPLAGEMAGARYIFTVFGGLPPWFDYVAGFAAAAGSSLVVWGADEVPALYQEIAISVPATKTAAFFKRFAREAADRSLREKRATARNTLLDAGIPVNTESFCAVLAAGNGDAVRRFLEAGFSPDERNKTGVPLLCLAARAGSLGMIELLIEAGANVNIIAHDRGNSAIIDAALGKHRPLIERLIQAGADVNVQSKDGQSALIIAVGLNDVETASVLLAAKADPDAPDSLGACARKYALLFNKPAMVALFQGALFQGAPAPA